MTENKKIFVIDTNVLISDPNSIFAFQDNEIVIPTMVLEELDNIKDRKDKNGASIEARLAIKNISELIKDASPIEILKGVKIKENEGIIRIFNEELMKEIDNKEDNQVKFLEEERNDNKFNCDNIIINVALKLQQENPNRYVCLVTKDINMSIKARSAGLTHVENYKKEQVIDDIKLLPSGYIEVENFLDSVDYDQSKITNKLVDIDVSLQKEFIEKLYTNLYILDCATNCSFKVKKINKDKNIATLEVNNYDNLMGKNNVFGLKARSIFQAIAIEELLNSDISLVSLLGPAGTGKTLLSLAAAIHLVVEEKKYEKIIICRSLSPLGEDIGFLPGTETEKMLPWMGAFIDNLEILTKYEESEHDTKRVDNPNEKTLEYLMKISNIQFKTINFMRGRSFNDTIIILDEAQSLTPFQMKSMLTRVGKNSKIICLGNLAQIDSNYITPLTSGLTHVVKKMKDFKKGSTITLSGIERSELAEFAENEL